MATKSDRWQVVCQDPGDGSGDLMVELPSELLEALGWVQGDDLIIEKDQDCIALKIKRKVGQFVS
nr:MULTISPECIES: AbrB/MazE/SpoVT family DNA-binding domain-containing protein [Pseudomonadaceae]